MKQFLSLLLTIYGLQAHGQTYRTEAFSDEIRTIQITKAGNWLTPPVINIMRGEYIVLSFDRLGENSSNRLRYKILHCNADQTPSPISEIDYIDGFNDNPLDDYALSVNTTVEYTNFRLEIPNNDIRLKLSGNYAILVYEDDDRDNLLLSASFAVIDPQLSLAGSVSSYTLLDANRERQQLSLVINYQDMNMLDPYNDLKVYVRQNERTDNQKSLLKPSIVQRGRLVYEQNRQLIFEAGNEYRRFETVSYRYNPLRIEHQEFRHPFYYAYVFPDISRAFKRYVYDEDQNGKFYIRNADANNSDTEADYFQVLFALKTEPVDGNVYINGNFTNNSFDDRYLMQYDYDAREYYLSLLLKQGAYNYQYLAGQAGKYSTAPLEGNYFETENHYQALVYYRGVGQRYDSLIGYLELGTGK
ncbi:MAG: DUF5103 domain-containing protein [Prevotella sp.]|jgi:hypothetical protein|nr:DUF5103 domain-containing protein [Prevotella sp.]